MAKDKMDAVSASSSAIDAALKEQLHAIEREEVPEKLLVLAQELQRLLREGGK